MYSRIRSWILDDDQEIIFQSATVLQKIENVRLLDRFNSRKPSAGTLYLTATHLIFVDPDAKKETWILHMHIASVEKLPISTQGSPLHFKCKTFLTVTFIIPKERDCHDLYISLQQLSQPANIEDLYCFHYTASSEDLSKKDGWQIYDPLAEFQRMGVPNTNWIHSLLNNNYEICDTYPQELFVPITAQTKIILSSSRFRSKGRFPVLTYLHKNQAALCRSSQPLSGFSARCLEDEQLLDCILRSNPSSKHMVVVDTRPKINAMANRAAGKGYENEAFYENIKFHFSGIENIHVMRTSLSKLIEITPTVGSFLNGVESSGWLRHVRCVLETSQFIANTLASNVSVLVHCSDGWDRTAQTCALAQILLDPYYRTLSGFQVLIEKEWLSFGHKYTDRCGHIQGDNKEISPIFTQFIDCVWQLLQILPCAFEFNERFLLVLHDHVYSVQFGTFIGNCQKDRIDLRLSERTYSFWGYAKAHETEYRNPLYRKDSTPDVVKPNLLPQNIRFWRGMYNRFENGVHPREPVGDILAATLEHSISLDDHVEFLSKRIAWLKEKLDKWKEYTQDNRTRKLNLENIIISNKILPNGDIKTDVGDVMCMRQVEESLVSAGALPATMDSMTDSTDNHVAEFPILTKTSPEKLTTDINDDVEGAPFKSLAGPSIKPSTLTVLSPLMSKLAVDWKTFRHIRECSCSTPFDHFSRKYHCWRCGEVFCTRCIDKKTPLPGHLSHSHVPVCRPCYKDVTRSLSVDTP